MIDVAARYAGTLEEAIRLLVHYHSFPRILIRSIFTIVGTLNLYLSLLLFYDFSDIV